MSGDIGQRHVSDSHRPCHTPCWVPGATKRDAAMGGQDTVQQLTMRRPWHRPWTFAPQPPTSVLATADPTITVDVDLPVRDGSRRAVQPIDVTTARIRQMDSRSHVIAKVGALNVPMVF